MFVPWYGGLVMEEHGSIVGNILFSMFGMWKWIWVEGVDGCFRPWYYIMQGVLHLCCACCTLLTVQSRLLNHG